MAAWKEKETPSGDGECRDERHAAGHAVRELDDCLEAGCARDYFAVA